MVLGLQLMYGVDVLEMISGKADRMYISQVKETGVKS